MRRLFGLQESLDELITYGSTLTALQALLLKRTALTHLVRQRRGTTLDSIRAEADRAYEPR